MHRLAEVLSADRYALRKLATHFLAMVKLAMIQRCLRILDPSDRT